MREMINCYNSLSQMNFNHKNSLKLDLEVALKLGQLLLGKELSHCDLMSPNDSIEKIEAVGNDTLLEKVN